MTKPNDKTTSERLMEILSKMCIKYNKSNSLDEVFKTIDQAHDQIIELWKEDKKPTSKEIKKGAIAICSLGRVGLITSEKPIKVTYNDGNKGVSWVGIQLTDGEVRGVGGDKGKVIKQKVGDPWMSRNPKVIGHINQAITQAEKNMEAL